MIDFVPEYSTAYDAFAVFVGLIAFVSIAITIIAMRNYLKFRNWRLLFLSFSFLLLAIPPTILVLQVSGALSGLSNWSIDELNYVAFIFSLASVVPFFLLAYIYMDERKKQSIKITKRQWILGSLLTISLISIYIIAFINGYNNEITFEELGTPDKLNIIYFFFNCLADILIIVIITSLFSYYRAKRTRNTLVVMSGFVCLLLSQAYGTVNFSFSMSDHFSSSAWSGTSDPFMEGLAFIGYAAFLAALLRLKVFR